MRTAFEILRPIVLTLLVSTGFAIPTLAQEASIPDPGLNAAIRAALQKPSGPLTEQDHLLRSEHADQSDGPRPQLKLPDQLLLSGRADEIDQS